MRIERCNFIDAGSSRLLCAQAHEDFHAETAFDAVVHFLRQYGLPATLTIDRDVRWIGSATQRDFPSALLQFLYSVGVQPNVLPPHHPELNFRDGVSKRLFCKNVQSPGILSSESHR